MRRQFFQEIESSFRRASTLGNPLRVRVVAVLAIKLLEPAVALHGIESGVPLELAEVDGTEVHRVAVVLHERVRALHHATIGHAMVDRKDVAHLVAHELERATQKEFLVVVLVARERVDAAAVLKVALAENEIEAAREEVLLGDPDEDERVRRNEAGELRDDRGRVVLAPRRSPALLEHWNGIPHLRRDSKIDLRVRAHPLDRLRVARPRAAQGLDVENRALRALPVRARPDVLLEALR